MGAATLSAFQKTNPSQNFQVIIRPDKSYSICPPKSPKGKNQKRLEETKQIKKHIQYFGKLWARTPPKKHCLKLFVFLVFVSCFFVFSKVFGFWPPVLPQSLPIPTYTCEWTLEEVQKTVACIPQQKSCRAGWLRCLCFVVTQKQRRRVQEQRRKAQKHFNRISQLETFI